MESAALIFQGGSAVAGGLAARGEAKAEQQQAAINAYIARTRALQTDTTARRGIEDELGTARAVMGANQQRPNTSVLEILNEIREVRGRERRIEFGNEMTRAADYRMQGANAAAKGRAAMTSGFIKAAPSIYDLYQVNR